MKETQKILNEIRKYGKIIKEGYFSEDEDPRMQQQMPSEDEYDEEMPQDDNEDEMDMDSNTESIDLDDNQVVNQLRKLALKGIQKYSEDVTSPLYEFYKKIWAECDKLITDAAKKQEIGGKKQ
jgi:hypothetical protein